MRPLFFCALIALSGCAAGSEDGEVTESNEQAATTGIPGCPGTGWIDPSSWSGLKGSYLRLPSLAPTGEISSLSVLADGELPPYSRTVTGAGVQTGKLSALPSNPAIGPAIAFYDNAGELRDLYWAPYLKRSAFTGKITAICMAKADGGETAFVLSRSGF
jgi:hypothetical protein